MKLLILIFLRAVRISKCFMRSLPKALSASAIVIAGAAAVLSLLRKGEGLSYADCFVMSLAVILLMWVAVSLIDVLSYGMNIHHMYDDELIGSAFSGIGHKSLMFEGALVTFHREKYREALDAFTSLSGGKVRLTSREEGVLEYYRGRCYQIMSFFPNAAACYEKCLKTEFSAPFTELFLARCYASGGETAKAADIYRSLAGGEGPLAPLARTEAGRMYLELNDGENALKWFGEAMDRRENYAEALGGAAIAYTLLHNMEKGEELFRLALLNHINDPDGFMSYFKSVQAAVVLGSAAREE
jgi:tetratricopeptide (TPR) repeat protein